ncbi:unnamed protein product [Gadus morhua 'NCC']
MKALIKTANERAPRLKGPQPSAEDWKLRAAARPPHARLIAATWPLLLAPHRLSAAVSQTAVQCPVPSARLRLPSSQSPAVGRPGVDVSLPPGAPQDSGEKRSRGSAHKDISSKHYRSLLGPGVSSKPPWTLLGSPPHPPRPCCSRRRPGDLHAAPVGFVHRGVAAAAMTDLLTTEDEDRDGAVSQERSEEKWS